MQAYKTVMTDAAKAANLDPAGISLRDNLGRKSDSFGASPALAGVSLLVPKAIAEKEAFIDALALKNEELSHLWAAEKKNWEDSIKRTGSASEGKHL